MPTQLPTTVVEGWGHFPVGRAQTGKRKKKLFILYFAHSVPFSFLFLPFFSPSLLPPSFPPSSLPSFLPSFEKSSAESWDLVAENVLPGNYKINMLYLVP